MTIDNHIRVPYSMGFIGQEEIAAVNEVLNTSTQMGKRTLEFESKIAATFGKKHGVMVNSGSSALELAMAISDMPEGSEVITPALTFSTTVSSLVHHRLIPSFVDIRRNTYCIDTDKIEAMITPKTRAIVAPHLVGNIVDWDEVLPLAKKHNLIIIEDSADTLGATIRGRPSGEKTDMSISSFYGSHVITCAGNGGILCVNNDEHLRRAKLLRSWGRSSSLFVESESIENRFNIEVDGIPYDAKFVFEEAGYNVEPSEIGAAYGLVQLEKLEGYIDKRIENFDRQLNFFKQYEDWFELPQQTPETRSGWIAYPMVIRPDAPFARRDMQIFFEKRNIQTRTVFAGNITRQPGFRNLEMRKAAEGYPEADHVMRGGILLACHQYLTEEMFAHVHQTFEDFAKSL